MTPTEARAIAREWRGMWARPDASELHKLATTGRWDDTEGLLSELRILRAIATEPGGALRFGSLVGVELGRLAAWVERGEARGS